MPEVNNALKLRSSQRDKCFNVFPHQWLKYEITALLECFSELLEIWRHMLQSIFLTTYTVVTPHLHPTYICN